MKLVGVIGEPATGKTALMRVVLARLGQAYTPFKFGKLLYGRQYPGSLYVLGIYVGAETFGGTDRLSMAVQPVAIRFLRNLAPKRAIVVFEGDRLTRAGFLGAARSVKLFLVETSSAEKARRHRARGDTQSPRFHRSRATLISRIARAFPVERLSNETDADLLVNAARIVREIQPHAAPRQPHGA